MRKKLAVISLICFLVSCNGLQDKKVLDQAFEYIENFFKKSDLKERTPTLILKNLPLSPSLKKWSTASGFILKPNKQSISIYSKDNELLGKIVKNGRHQVVTTFPLIGKKAVNPLLDAKLFPNTTYKIENSIFKTDKLARVVSAEISTIPKNIIKRHRIKGARENAKAMAKDGIKGVDHGGHLIAHTLGGNSGAINIVAQSGRLNIGKFASVEDLIRKNRTHIKNYKVDVIYKGNSKRPVAFRQKFEFRGIEKKLEKLRKKNPDFRYLKKKDLNGHPYFNCIIFHKNIKK